MYNEILNTLYKKYFKGSYRHSAVTSSHWRTVKDHSVTKNKEGWVAKALVMDIFEQEISGI